MKRFGFIVAFLIVPGLALAKPACDVRWSSRLQVYQLLNSNRPIKNLYDYDSAIQLRDKAISAGECTKRRLERCDLRPIDYGHEFRIFRGGKTFITFDNPSVAQINYDRFVTDGVCAKGNTEIKPVPCVIRPALFGDGFSVGLSDYEPDGAYETLTVKSLAAARRELSKLVSHRVCNLDVASQNRIDAIDRDVFVNEGAAKKAGHMGSMMKSLAGSEDASNPAVSTLSSAPVQRGFGSPSDKHVSVIAKSAH